MNAAARRRLLGAVRRTPLLREALILGWRDGRLPLPKDDLDVEISRGVRMSFRGDDHTQRKMALGIYERGETRLVERILRPGDTFVDVGAHVGWFSAIACRRVGPSGRVVSIEGFPANAERLAANLAPFADRSTIHRVAAGDAAGTIRLAQQPGSDSGSVTAAPAEGADLVEVPVTPIDDVCAELECVRLMKMDVEGYETRALTGAASTLRRTDNLIVEINPHALGANGTSESDVRSLLADAGFTTVAAVGSSRFRRSHEVFNLLASR